MALYESWRSAGRSVVSNTCYEYFRALPESGCADQTLQDFSRKHLFKCSHTHDKDECAYGPKKWHRSQWGRMRKMDTTVVIQTMFHMFLYGIIPARCTWTRLMKRLSSPRQCQKTTLKGVATRRAKNPGNNWTRLGGKTSDDVYMGQLQIWLSSSRNHFLHNHFLLLLYSTKDCRL